MLEYLSFLSGILVVATGLYVLWHGDWRAFKLKYAGVALSTVSGIDLLTMYFFTDVLHSCTQERIVCINWMLYHVIRNVALVLFHISVGRDAIRFKNKDRRRCHG